MRANQPSMHSKRGLIEDRLKTGLDLYSGGLKGQFSSEVALIKNMSSKREMQLAAHRCVWTRYCLLSATPAGAALRTISRVAYEERVARARPEPKQLRRGAL